MTRTVHFAPSLIAIAAATLCASLAHAAPADDVPAAAASGVQDTTRVKDLLGATATTELETGEAIDADDLAAGGGSTTARAALRLSTELLALVPVLRQSPLQAFARIHASAAAGSVPDDELGRPTGPDGAARLGALSRRLLQPTTAPALVVAALAHAEIASSGAFASHGGVVARAVERLILVERGLDPASVTIPEAGHAGEPRGYASALAAYGTGTEAGVGQWLRYASQAFARGAEASPLAG